MDYSKAGRYACIVDVKGFDQIQSTTHVQIKGECAFKFFFDSLIMFKDKCFRLLRIF